MSNLNKKQVNALLKVMSKDETHPVLRNAHIDEYNGKTVLVTTNGYTLSAINIVVDSELVGKTIRREAIEVWYKLATARNKLDGEALAELASNGANLSDITYPEWKKLLPDGYMSGETTMKFNADYAKVLQDLSGEGALAWKLYGTISPMIATTDNGLYVMMPMKQ